MFLYTQIGLQFELHNPIKPSENNIVKNVHNYGPGFHIEMDLKINRKPSGEWVNVFGITDRARDRWLPALWLHKSGKICIQMNISGMKVHTSCYSDKEDTQFYSTFPYHIVFEQWEVDPKGFWIFEAKINGKTVVSLENESPENVDTAQIYMSARGFNAADVKVNSFRLKNFGWSSILG